MSKTLTKTEFEDRANIRTQYDCFRDERGDACGFYDDYLNAHYSDYLKGWLYTELPRDTEHLGEND
jgi:regulator of sirC expression with transglutaminase-like and TPR domain